MLPTFLVIGARKAGTTSLFHYLRSHRDVFMPEQKRLEFFSGPTWGRGVDWYAAQFAGARGATAVGEASSSYSRHPAVPGVPERIAAVVPDARVVYVLRHPIERMRSQYTQAVAEGYERRPFREAVLADAGEYVAPSRYAMQLERYLESFPREQVLLVLADDLRERRAETLARVYGFVGVDPTWEPPEADREFHRAEDLRRASGMTSAIRGSGAWRAVRRAVPGRVRQAAWRAGSRAVTVDEADRSLPPGIHDELVARLGPDLVRLREYLGPGFSCWGLVD